MYFKEFIKTLQYSTVHNSLKLNITTSQTKNSVWSAV